MLALNILCLKRRRASSWAPAGGSPLSGSGKGILAAARGNRGGGGAGRPSCGAAANNTIAYSMAVPVTEDTPPDLLAGSMDLTVLLPDGRATKTSVQRATPMMDLLVQLCTAQRLPPGGHSLQPLGEKGALPYKPSTPIGLLDAWSVRVLPKGAPTTAHDHPHPHQLPFQHTFRLQVHLPRNQLLVSRVTPQMGLAAVLKMACDEKNLDPNKYELRHPINLEERLRPELTLGDYGLTEVCVVARDAGGADALALQREQERRRRRAKQQHGAVAPGRQPGGEVGAITGSVSSGSLGGRSSSPDSAPAAPPPRAPARKRRPAPPPPAANTATTTDADTKGCSKQAPAAVISKAGSKQVVSHHDGAAPTVTHSRTSSDSSGYHEASVLSDGPDTHPGDKAIAAREMPPPPTTNSTLPRRSKLPPATGTTSVAVPKRTGPTVGNSMPLSRSVSNLAAGAAGRAVHGDHSSSTSSLSSTGRGPRKKKAAPPPPAARAAPTPDRSAAAPAPAPVRTPAESRTLPRLAPSAEDSDARRSAGIEEEKKVASPERRPSCETVAKHHQQQQRSSAELPAEKADLYAKLQRRLPSRGDSVTSTSSSGSDDAAAATAGRGSVTEEQAPTPAPAVRPSRSRDRASAAVRDRADVPPQPDVVAVQAQPPPPGPVSSKHSSTVPDEDDLAVDEGIGNDDAAEEVARAFASAAAELEAAILAEDLAAAAAEAEEHPADAYSTFDPPQCPTTLAVADPPPRLPPSPELPAVAVAADGEEWHYEIPAPPSAFRDAAETPPPTPWSYAEGEVRSKANPLYESGQFDMTDTKEKSESPRESTVAVERRNSDRTSVGDNRTVAEEEVAERERALTGAERQLQGVLDAKARLLLARPQTQAQLIQGPAADAAVKDADSEPGESSPSDVADVVEDSLASQEHHSHSLLNHHHAGQLHHGHHHHHHQQPHHHHDHHQHSADAGMPAYLTETIDTLEGFEDLIAVGSGSRPAEEHRNTESGGRFDADPAVAAEADSSSSGGERPVAVGEVVESSKSSVTLETTSVTAEGPKEAKTDSTSGNETPTETRKGSVGAGDLAVGSGDVSPQRRSSGEAEVEDGKTRKDEDARAESDRQRRAQRRRTVEVAGPLVNFTITTYRREIDPDKIFAEAEDAAESRVSAMPAPVVVAAGDGERRASQVSRSNSVGGSARGSSAGSSRRGSQAEQQPGRSHGQGVKRSVSSVYAALQDVAAREEARARGGAESANKDNSGSSQLQSLQVLRSILPQLKTTLEQKQSGSDRSDETADTSAVIPQPEQVAEDSQKKTEEAPAAPRQPQPYRPPAVSFASWGERPRSRAVSLKVDSDYRVGGAHTKAKQPSQEPQPTDTSTTTSGTESPTVDGGVQEKRVEAAPAEQNALVRSGEAPPPAAPKVEPTVIRISTAEPRIRAVQLKAHPPPFGAQPQLPRSDPAALTMRIISHTTAAPFVRQGATSVAVNGAEQERVVPVVRAVELKSSALPQQLQDRDAPDGGGSGEDGQRFVGVSSLAKRFSFLGDNTVVQRRNSGGGRGARRPVSELVTASDAALAAAEPGGPVHRAGSFTSLVSASRAGQLGRSDSSDDARTGHSAGLVSQNGHSSSAVKQMPATFSAAPKGFPLPVVKGFRVPGAGAAEPRKGITLVTKPRAGAAAPAPVPVQNPHEQLMAAIRGFGGTGSLRNQTQNIAECES